jgi:hypothetical protein
MEWTLEMDQEYSNIIEYYESLCDEEQRECEVRRDNRIETAKKIMVEEYEDKEYEEAI